MVEKIKRVVMPLIAQGKLICALGGEHTITVGLLQAMQTRYPDLTVVALDAHADMRESFEGSKLSHACVMRRAYELGRPLTLLGVRSYSQDEYQLLRVAPRLKLFKAKELHTPEGWQAALDAPPRHFRAGVSLHRLGRPGPGHHAGGGHPGTGRFFI